jgi:prevent-host-death family protein
MFVLSGNDKGAIAEIEIAAAAMRLGVGVYRPLSGHSRADLVFDTGDRLWRVQCKWGRLRDSGSAVVARLSGSSSSPKGYVTSTYSEAEVDLFAIYSGALDRSFLLRASMLCGMHEITLRLVPPRNNQRACINLADQFAFEGAVAQLGERVAGSHEVRGSIPLSSTSTPPASGPAVVVGANPFRDHLGFWMDRVADGEEVIITRHGKPRIRMLPVEPPLSEAA